VPDLLGGDAEDQVAVLAGQVHVPALEHVLHRHGDLPVLAAEQLLQLAGEHCVRLVGCGLELQFLTMEEHPYSLGVGDSLARDHPAMRAGNRSGPKLSPEGHGTRSGAFAVPSGTGFLHALP
jgi:hypothetical protein